MGASDNALTIASVAATVQTVGQGRAVLGKVAELLKQAYGLVDTIGGADHPLTSNTLGILATSETRDAAKSRIDVVNAYAGGVFALLPADDARQTDLLTTRQSGQIALCMRQAQDALKDIEEAAGVDYWDLSQIFSDTVASVAGRVGGGLQAVTNAAAAGGAALFSSAWPLALGAVVLLGGYLFFRFGRALVPA